MSHRISPTRFLFTASVFCMLALASCVTGPKPDSKPEPGRKNVLTDREKDMAELETIYRLAQKGELKEAVSRISALSVKRPDGEEYRLLHASLLISMQDYDGARLILDGLLSAKPDNVEALFLMAELDRFSGDGRNLAATLEKILVANPGNVEALSSLGDLHFDGKNYAKAEAYFAKALAIEPADVASLTGMARVQYRREDFKAAKASLDKAVAAAPDEPLVYLDRSRVNYQLGKYSECEADLDKSIALEPYSSWNFLERGRLYMDTGRGDAALADFTRSIKLDPGYFLAYVYRAAIYEETGRDAEALDDYKKVTQLNVDYWYAFEAIGVLAFRRQLWGEAFTAFDKAAGFTENHGEYYLAAALALMLDGQTKAARDYAAKTLPKINRESEPAQWLMLRLVYDQNETTSELELKISSEKSMDAKAALLFYLGEYWIAKGRPELGGKYLTMSMEADRQGTNEWRMAQAELKRLGINP